MDMDMAMEIAYNRDILYGEVRKRFMGGDRERCERTAQNTQKQPGIEPTITTTLLLRLLLPCITTTTTILHHHRRRLLLLHIRLLLILDLLLHEIEP